MRTLRCCIPLLLAALLTGCAEDATPVGETPSADAEPVSAAEAKINLCAEGVAALSEITWELQQTERYAPEPDGTGLVLVRENPEARARLQAESESLAAELGITTADGFSARALVAPAQAAAAQAQGPVTVESAGEFLRGKCEQELVKYNGLTQDEVEKLNGTGKYAPPTEAPLVPSIAPEASAAAEKACAERLRVLYVSFLDGEITLEELRAAPENPVDAKILNDALDALEAGEISNADVSTVREMGCIEAY